MMKYLLMGTSSNFGNVFSMAAASVFLPFLPMLPTQILLNNFLYDVAQVPIPTDNVDESYLRVPQRWNMRVIRDFMLFIGPISSLFDFLTFYVLLRVFHADERMFHSGWFVESLATQTLVLFVIRTMGNPLRSRPSRALTITAVAITGSASPFRGRRWRTRWGLLRCRAPMSHSCWARTAPISRWWRRRSVTCRDSLTATTTAVRSSVQLSTPCWPMTRKSARHDRVADSRCRSGILTDGRGKHIVRRQERIIERLGNPIGHEDAHVAGLQLDAFLEILGVLQQTQGRPPSLSSWSAPSRTRTPGG